MSLSALPLSLETQLRDAPWRPCQSIGWRPGSVWYIRGIVRRWELSGRPDWRQTYLVGPGDERGLLPFSRGALVAARVICRTMANRATLQHGAEMNDADWRAARRVWGRFLHGWKRRA